MPLEVSVSKPEDDLNNPPRPLLKADGKEEGGPTTPSLSRGVVQGTTVDVTNKNQVHVCDFVLDLKKSIGLKKFIKAIAKSIREGIRSIMRMLGLTDATGEYSKTIALLKKIAEEIRYIQKEYIQPIIDFQKFVLAVLVKIRALIQWILSLPAKLLQLLQECLKKLIEALASVFKDALKEAAKEVPLGSGGSDELFKASLDVLEASTDLLEASGEAIALTAAIATSATAGLLVPVSLDDIANADKVINDYTSKNPKPEDSNNPTPEQNKSVP
jgi:hypothetical protein